MITITYDNNYNIDNNDEWFVVHIMYNKLCILSVYMYIYMYNKVQVHPISMCTSTCFYMNNKLHVCIMYQCIYMNNNLHNHYIMYPCICMNNKLHVCIMYQCIYMNNKLHVCIIYQCIYMNNKLHVCISVSTWTTSHMYVSYISVST